MNKQSWLVSQLRRISQRWPPRNELRKEARIKQGIYLCSGYNRKPHEIRAKDVRIDHIEPIVPVTGWDGWEGLIDRLFCEKEGLQILCSECHAVKTKLENKKRK